MLKVNIHNYEAYFLDYIEGNLSDEDRQEVEKFLALYPDKFDELHEFENITIPVEESISFDKSILKKGLSDVKIINDQNFEEFCIANLEGDLDKSTSDKYQEHLTQHPEKQKTEDLYRKVYLVAEESIKYPHKSKLKHFDKALFVRRLAFTGVAAASIGLLFTIQNPFNRQDIEQPAQVISQTVETPTQETRINENSQVGIQLQQTLNNSESKKTIKHSQSKLNISTDKNLQTVSYETEQPVILEKVSVSKPKIGVSSIASNQLAYRNTNETKEAKEVIPPVESKKVVSLTELAFNEVKKVVPKGVQELADKRPDIKGVAENSRKEINELLNKQVTIEKEIDEEGNIRSFSLNTSLFAFYTTKVKK